MLTHPATKILKIAAITLVIIASAVAAGDRVEQFVQSHQPLIIDGNWLNPENGGYLLIMTDEYLTVNGYEYVHPEDRLVYEYVPPDKEKNFLDWICRTTSMGANEILEEGGSPEEARVYMERRYKAHVEDGVFWYEVDDHGGFRLYHKDYKFPLGTSAPTRPRSEIPQRTFRENVIESKFTRLVHHLERDYFVMRGTRNASYWAFAPADAERVKQELKDVSNQTETTFEYGEETYRSVLICERFKLGPRDVELLINPRVLIKR